MVDLERNKAVVRAFVEAINAQNWDRLDALVAPDFVRHSHAQGLSERLIPIEDLFAPSTLDAERL